MTEKQYIVYMKYLDKYHSIDEKIKWQHLLLALGIYHGIKDYKSFNIVNHIYKTINSPKANPTKTEQMFFDSVRNQMIESVKKSDQFNKFGKDWVIDSLKNIKIKVLDSIDFEGSETKGTLGAYFYIKPIKNAWVSKPAEWVSGSVDDNVVLIKREILKQKDLDEILIHELYHYLDRMWSYPQEKSRANFIDKKAFVDDAYSLDKMCHILMANQRNYDTLPKEFKQDIKSIYNGWKSRRSYYLQPGELFARWHTLKTDMLKHGCLNNINDCPKEHDIYEFLWADRRVDAQYVPLLILLDWDRLEEFNKII